MSALSEVLLYWRTATNISHLPKWRQCLEMAVIYLLRGIGPRYYVQSRWGRRSIAFKDKWAHMNRSEYRRFISRWNPYLYQKNSQHKFIEKATLTLVNFPTPKFVAFVHKMRGRTATGDPLRDAEQLASCLSLQVGKRLCFKRAEGFGGFGFQNFVIQGAPPAIRMLDQSTGRPILPAEWWAMYGEDAEGFEIEEYLAQHADLARINPSSVNTVRIWVILTEQRCEAVGGYFRMGRSSSSVDNTSSGGLVGTLDVSTGRIKELVAPRQAMAEFERHPDSGVMIKGIQLPYWKDVLQMACEAIRTFPQVHVVGLDIAFGANGPILIELNVCPDYIGCAWMDMPLKRLEQQMMSAAS